MNTSLIQKQEAKSKMIEQAKIDLIKVLSKNSVLSIRHKKEFDKIKIPLETLPKAKPPSDNC